MVSAEIIGIITLASIAVVVMLLYLCKCYSDCALSRHKENITPITLDGHGLGLISIDNINPTITHDRYGDENDLVNEDHNDFAMVVKSVERSMRRDSYRNTNGKFKHRVIMDSVENSDIISPNPTKNYTHSVSDGNESHLEETTFSSSEIRDAPVLVHNGFKPNSTSVCKDNMDNGNNVQTLYTPHNNHSVIPTEKDIEADAVDNFNYFDEVNPIQKEINELEQQEFEETEILTSIPNSYIESNPDPENIFYIPNEALSNETSVGNFSKHSEIRVNTLDDLGQNENSKSYKKSRKHHGKLDNSETPKGQRRRKKSVSDSTVYYNGEEEPKSIVGNHNPKFTDYNLHQTDSADVFPTSNMQHDQVLHGRTSQL